MGEHGDPQVYPGLHHTPKSYSGRLQLAGIRSHQKCRVPVRSNVLWLSTDHVLKYYWHSYNMQYSGQSALHIAVLVAFTQLIPEHQVQILGVLKARVKVGCSPASMSGSSISRRPSL
jgi:hypothetical protein